MREDIWVVIDGKVYDVTNLISESSGHPGGAEIPLEYAGKDASEFWNDIHGHLKDEILQDITEGAVSESLSDLGLQLLPRVVGIADGDPPAAARGPNFPSTNWAGNVVWGAADVASPTALPELQSLVAKAPGHVRVVGRSHSFTPVCDTDGLLISLARMQEVLKFDDEQGLLTIEGGTTYTAVNAFLSGTKWALPNLATLPHFTVAGSMSMGTHGSSGVKDGRAQLGNQASQVVGIQFVLGDGSLKNYSRDADEEFPGTLVSLGCLGVVSSITLACVPAFTIQQCTYIDHTIDDIITNFRQMLNCVDSFSWLVDWPEQEEDNPPPVPGKTSGMEGAVPDDAPALLGRNRLLIRNFYPVGDAPEPYTPAVERWGGRLLSDADAVTSPTVMSSSPVVGPWFEHLNSYGAGIPSGAVRCGISLSLSVCVCLSLSLSVRVSLSVCVCVCV